MVFRKFIYIYNTLTTKSYIKFLMSQKISEMDEKMSVGRPVRGRVHGRKERVLSSDASADA